MDRTVQQTCQNVKVGGSGGRGVFESMYSVSIIFVTVLEVGKYSKIKG